MTQSIKIKSPWVLIALSCLVLSSVLGLITLPSWTALWHLWTEHGSGYSHGPLIIAVGFWLVYEHWFLLQRQQSRSQPRIIVGIVLGIAASCGWAFGYLSGIAMLQWLTLPVIGASLMAVISRQAISWHSLAPWLSLYFAVPIWELLVPGLQSLAVLVVSSTVKFLGIPAYIEGIRVSIPGGVFVVEGGCSGVRYLLVSIALTSLWSYLHIPNWRKAAVFVAFGIVASIISNWIRIFSIVTIGYKTQMQSPLVYDHEFFGWILFALTLVPIGWLGLRLEKQATQTRSSVQVAPQWSWRQLVVGSLVIGLMPVVAQALVFIIQPQSMPSFASSLLIITTDQGKIQLEKSTSTMPSFGGWQPDFPGVNQWNSTQYQPKQLHFLIGHIPKQTPQRELLSSSNQMSAQIKPGFWQSQQRDEYVQIQNLYGQQWIMKTHYRVAGALTQPGIAGKIQQLKGLMQLRYDGQIILAGLPCAQSCDEAKGKLDRIIKSFSDKWFEQ